MKARILPREEWHKLAVTGRPVIGSALFPDDAHVIVIEDGDRIVAALEAFRVTHFDGLWIDPEYRGNAGLGRRLIKTGIQTAKDLGASDWVWGTSGTDHTDDLYGRLGGVKALVNTFIIPLGGKVGV